MVKNPSAMQEAQETQVQFLGWEDPLEKAMASRSSLLAWRTPWTEEPGGLQSMGSQRQRLQAERLVSSQDIPAIFKYSFKPEPNGTFVTIQSPPPKQG